MTFSQKSINYDKKVLDQKKKSRNLITAESSEKFNGEFYVAWYKMISEEAANDNSATFDIINWNNCQRDKITNLLSIAPTNMFLIYWSSKHSQAISSLS